VDRAPGRARQGGFRGHARHRGRGRRALTSSLSGRVLKSSAGRAITATR
jgi:hypothetical protein